MPTISRAVPISCVWALALMSHGVLAAQDTVLHIAVVSGEDAIHAAAEHVAKPVTVAVTDGTGRPVEGARVSFQVPQGGPGGVFANGLQTDLAITGPNGHASVRALQLNRAAGRFLIRVTAAKDQARAGIVVQQYIGDPNAARESADRSAAVPPPAKVAPGAALPATPEGPKPAPVDVTTATPPQPKKATQAEGLATAIGPRAGVAPLKPARIPTIIITQRSAKPVVEPMVSRGSKSHKKWIWIGILAAGGVSGAFVGSSMAAAVAHSPASTAAAILSVTIGAPTINIGKP